MIDVGGREDRMTEGVWTPFAAQARLVFDREQAAIVGRKGKEPSWPGLSKVREGTEGGGVLATRPRGASKKNPDLDVATAARVLVVGTCVPDCP